LVDFYKRATFEEAKAVKIRCKQELLEQARNADILAQAQINGEESLKNFFSLLVDEPDLKVEFHNLPHQNKLNIIIADTVVTVSEALLIDSIIQETSKKINEAISPDKEIYQEELDIFINQLNGLSFIQKGYPFNVFMTEAAKILDHKLFISQADYDSIAKFRKPISEKLLPNKKAVLFAAFPDSNKYKVLYPEFVVEFNAMLNVLELETSKMDEQRGDTVTLLPDQIKRFLPNNKHFHVGTITSFVNADTITYHKVVHKNIARSFKFTDLKYPWIIIPNESYLPFRMSDTTLVDSVVESYIDKSDIFTGDAYGDSLRVKDVKTIKEFKSEEIKHEIKTKPVKWLTSSLKKIFN